MRLPAPLRLLISCGFIGLFAFVSLVYGKTGAIPSQQTSGTPSATPNPNQPIDLLVDEEIKTGAPSTSVTFNFQLVSSVTNTCASPNQYNITVSNTTLTPIFPSTVTVLPGGNVGFTVRFNLPANVNPGDRFDAIVTATCSSNNGISDRELVSVIVAGSTPTASPTNTRTPTFTSTPTPTGSPTLTFTPGPICRDNFEVDNDPAQAREIRVNVPQARAICPSGDQDWAFFGGIDGKVYTVDVPEMADGLDLTVGLYNEAGELLAFNDDFPRDNNPRDIKPRILSWRAPYNGRFYIRVRDAAGGGGNNLIYTLSLIDESFGPTPTQIAELCSDLFEPDGLPEQARLMVIREIQPNHRFCPSGDADWVRVFMKVGATYVLRTDSKNLPGADPVMVLADRDGTTILAINDDTGDSLDARISFSPPVDGFYFIQVKNVGDIGNQFILYDLFFEQPGISSGSPTTTGTAAPVTPSATGTTRPTADPGGTPAATTGPGTGTPAPTITVAATNTTTAYPAPTTAVARQPLNQIKGAPPFVNGPAKNFVDPALAQVWNRTDLTVARQKATRTWIWGPSGLIARAELYQQANGGVRQVQYFDKARMEITDWNRDRTNQWFVTNGLLVQELVTGRLQIGDNQFAPRDGAWINIAGDEDDATGPTYASFQGLLARVEDRTGQVAAATLRRDGSTEGAAARNEARLVYYVGETGHNIPAVFWDFLNTRGPIGDGSSTDTLVNWVFAMGYPISEPYWTTVRIGGQSRQVLVQAFQRRVLTYTPENPAGWQVEMGNVGRHYYLWRYGVRP